MEDERAEAAERFMRPLLRLDVSDLKRRHPENPLFRPRLTPPLGWVLVRHFTAEHCLADIAVSGLTARSKTAMSPFQRQLEDIFAAVVPEGYSRAHSILAYPSLHPRLMRHQLELVRLGLTRARILLEVAVDPHRATVADTHLWNEAARALQREDDADGIEALAQRYWSQRQSLAEYREAVAKGKDHFHLPEVLIPPDPGDPFGSIRPERIRVAAILEDHVDPESLPAL